MMQDGDMGIVRNVGITVLSLVGFTIFLIIVANVVV